MNKKSQLEKVAKEIENCKACREDKTGKMVFGEGSADAEIAFIGEAPGKEEARVGRPFIGRSGKLLRLLITEIGLKEEDVYITSPVKYLPNRGTPTKKDIRHGRIYLLKQLDIIKPKVIVLLGSVASFALLENPIAVTKQHGQIFKKDNRKYFITFHPAAALRFAPLKKELI